jgi:hypothetical protein
LKLSLKKGQMNIPPSLQNFPNCIKKELETGLKTVVQNSIEVIGRKNNKRIGFIDILKRKIVKINLGRGRGYSIQLSPHPKRSGILCSHLHWFDFSALFSILWSNFYSIVFFIFEFF